ncbi:putative lipid II flippase FtsW [bacterium]|nr:putative lipid II flippase FtsW [bacterium]
MISSKKNNATDLPIFLGIVSTLVILGFVFVYSSSSVYGLEKFGSAHYFLKKQFIGLILGLIGFTILKLLPIHFIKKISPLVFLTTLGLTALTRVPFFAVTIHGSSRWLRLFGFTFQPSEMLKFALIVYVSYFISKKIDYFSSFFKTYLPLLIITGATSALLLMQPDFGLTVTLCATIFILLFIMQFPKRFLLSTLAFIIPAAITLIYLKPYRFKRVLTFLNPWADPKGAGFQIIQSLIAIGSGSFWGVGISNSRQKFFYLPMQHTDFIFSIIAEETGFIGSFCLILLYTSFAYFGIKIATNLHDPFARLTILGFTVLISLQAITNLAVTTGLVPTKGVGLPFVSYGATGLVCSLAMLGLVSNLATTQTKIAN